jgi:hypothetical protein
MVKLPCLFVFFTILEFPPKWWNLTN